MLAQHFPGRTPIECTDEAQMRAFDVIFAQMILIATPQMFSAVEKRVREDGKGLVIRVGFGIQEPGLTAQVLALNGMKQGVYGWNAVDQACDVTAKHSALGTIAVGKRLMLEPNGMFGIPVGDTLAKVDSGAIEPLSGDLSADRSQYVFPAFHASQFGKGRVFVASYLGINNSDGTLQAVREINSNGVRWAAGRLP
jgi:hypothetical protein